VDDLKSQKTYIPCGFQGFFITDYLSVPVGPQTIEFNAQRIFNPNTILNEAHRLGLDLIEFCHVDDNGDYHRKSSIDDAAACKYGCGCFLFKRRL
jgi:hypothetical protein